MIEKTYEISQIKLAIYLRIDYAGDFVDFYKSVFFHIIEEFIKEGSV